MPKTKKPEKPRCPKCHTGGYKELKSRSGDRPAFECTQCSYYWTCGKDGGKYKLEQ